VKGLSSVVATVTQEQAMALGTPLLSMFVYTPPRMVFTELEQDLIRAALGGAPDPMLAEQLEVPLTSIKPRRTRIQQRAFHAVPKPSPTCRILSAATREARSIGTSSWTTSAIIRRS
jgi:hypothetical protein